jgi:SAM-dependent methyltransferase
MHIILNAMRRDLGFRVAWRVRRALAARSDSDRVLGALERPDRRQLYSRWVDVRGWALSRDADVVIRVFAGRSLLREMAPTLPRPDVVARLPSWAAGRACGFDEQISLDSAPRRFWLRIVAVRVDDPTRVRTLGVSLLTRASARHRTRPRAAYRDVWNAASQSLTDARFSVSGTADVDELERSGASTADDIVVEAGVAPTDTVLEIGCGVGRVGAKLAPRCAQWIGADVSDQMLGHALRALQSLRNVSFVRLNGVDLAGVTDASIDVAYCTGVFMHLDEWDRFRYLHEAFRVLKPGGRVYVDNFNLLSDEGWTLFTELCQIDPIARPSNISKSSTPAELTLFATKAGFADIRVRTGGLWVTVVGTKPLGG